MQKKDDLIQENIELKARLDLAEKWMRREVASSVLKIQKEMVVRHTRNHVQATWNQEGIDVMTQKILNQYGDVLKNTPKYTLERLIDAEIYWHTLQEYPQMDALPIVIAYQKILDTWLEHKLIVPYRSAMNGNIQHALARPLDGIERDIISVLEKKYTLSLGRFYQVLLLVRHNSPVSGFSLSIIDFWKTHYPQLFHYLTSDAFFNSFSSIMEREIWSKKRHETKVNYTDARMVRDSFVSSDDQDSLFKKLFSY